MQPPRRGERGESGGLFGAARATPRQKAARNSGASLRHRERGFAGCNHASWQAAAPQSVHGQAPRMLITGTHLLLRCSTRHPHAHLRCTPSTHTPQAPAQTCRTHVREPEHERQQDGEQSAGYRDRCRAGELCRRQRTCTCATRRTGRLCSAPAPACPINHIVTPLSLTTATHTPTSWCPLVMHSPRCGDKAHSLASDRKRPARTTKKIPPYARMPASPQIQSVE